MILQRILLAAGSTGFVSALVRRSAASRATRFWSRLLRPHSGGRSLPLLLPRSVRHSLSSRLPRLASLTTHYVTTLMCFFVLHETSPTH